MNNYQGNRPHPSYLPNCAPPILPAPECCVFHYNERSRWASCACKQFAVMHCHSKDTAKAIWAERHMGQDPAAVVGRVNAESGITHG